MTWTFARAPGGTQETVTAEHAPAGISPEDYAEGLNSSLEKLARHVEA